MRHWGLTASLAIGVNLALRLLTIGVLADALINPDAERYGLRNVRGTWDTINDLVVGAVASLVYGAAYAWWRRR
jgi:hypothetical protein